MFYACMIPGRQETFIFLEDGEPTKAMVLLQQLVSYIIKEYPVKKQQIYVGGLSMGGMGTFELVRRNPSVFAAAFPICGGAHPNTAEKLKFLHQQIYLQYYPYHDCPRQVHKELCYPVLKKQL